MSRGPQAIVQPGGSVAIPYSPTAASIQTAINANPGLTTFWVEAGVRAQTAALVPKSGNTFVFELGAILDGSGWSTSVFETGAFRAHNDNIDDVTLRNGTIRNMPQRGVHAYKDFASGWVVEDFEIHHCKYGFHMPDNGILRRSLVHHCIGTLLGDPNNRGGGYVGYQSVGLLIDDNEISYCGEQQKIQEAGAGHIIRNNFFHHNAHDVWFDGNHTDVLIHDNICEDASDISIFYEVSADAQIYNNIVRRAMTGIMLSTSHTSEVHHNTIEDCWRGIQLFLYQPIVGFGAIVMDLRDNNVHHNSVALGTRSGSLASGFSYAATPGATPLFLAPYLTNAKNNYFIDNTYTVPTTGQWWFWG